MPELINILTKRDFALSIDKIKEIYERQSIMIENLKKEELNPYHASSYGLGEQIKQALLINKIKKIVVGIGGSASSDAGSGMLEALGVRFYDESGKIINNLNNEGLAKVENIDTVEANNILNYVSIYDNQRN